MILLSFIFSLLVFIPISIEHEFYVSVIEIEHSPEKAIASFKCRVFSDDLQVGLQSEFDLESPPPLSALCTGYQVQLAAFFSQHLSVEVNGVELVVEKFECASEAGVHEVKWIVDSIYEIRSLALRADYLMDIYPDQTQMVHISSGEKRRTLRLTRKSPEAEVELKN